MKWRRKVVNFLIPGNSRWSGRTVREAAEYYAGQNGLLLSCRFPPTHNKLLLVEPVWSSIRVALDGIEVARFSTTWSGPFWVGDVSGVVTITAVGLQGVELLHREVEVDSAGPTIATLVPAMTASYPLLRRPEVRPGDLEVRRPGDAPR